MDPDVLDAVFKQMKANLLADPLALLQPIPDGGEMQMLRCMNLELALFVAHLTGAAVYTDQRVFWRQLHEQTRAATDRHSRWQPLAGTMASHSFPIELNPLINLEIRTAGKLCRMRRFFRHCWTAAITRRGEADDQTIARELATRLENAVRRSASEWDRCSTTTGPSKRLRRRIELSAPPDCFHLNSVHRLLVTSGRSSYLASVPFAFLLSAVDEPTSKPPARRAESLGQHDGGQGETRASTPRSQRGREANVVGGQRFADDTPD